MTTTFQPKLDILPPAQRRLWSSLAPAAGLGFTLYGGTALALRLGHRDSIDFDFFSESPLDRVALNGAFAFMPRSVTLQDQVNTLVVQVPGETHDDDTVKVSFFGGITFGRVGEPETTSDGVLLVASFDDLMATKLKVMLQRAEAKDYRDVAAMLRHGVDLARGMASARLLYQPHFQPSESLKSLTFFGDGDLKELSSSDRETLIHAVETIQSFPDVERRSESLGSADLIVESEPIPPAPAP